MLSLSKDYWYKAPILLYVAGFLVHNIYLSQFHSSEFDLLQAKYIFTGFTFIATCMVTLAVILFRVNTSYIPSSYSLDSLLPWLLRIFCFVYFLYGIIIGDNFFHSFNHDGKLEGFSKILFVLYGFALIIFANLVFIDPLLEFTKGDFLSAKITRSVIRIISIPIIIASLFIATINQYFLGLLLFVLYFFIGLSGLALNQYDHKHDYEVKLLDSETSKTHQSNYLLLFSGVFILFSIMSLMNMYAKYFYPNIPASYGGNKNIEAILEINNTPYTVQIINESNSWLLYKTKENDNATKVKINEIDKIEYLIKKSNK